MRGTRRGKGRARMASRFFAIGTAAVLAAVAAIAAVSTLRHPHLRPGAAPGTARLHAFGSRSRSSVRAPRAPNSMARSRICPGMRHWPGPTTP